MKIIKPLISLKKRYPALWALVETANGYIFRFLYMDKVKRNAEKNLKDYALEKYEYRFLNNTDLTKLSIFFQNQEQDQFSFFKPHRFDTQTLEKLFKNPSFLLFGVFENEKLIGYFFLRCFINKQCFTGRIVDAKYQGQGIAKKMGKILHHIAWDSNFRVFGTASKENIKSLKSYQAINNYKIIKELNNGYIYFEYLRSEEKPIK